MDKEIDRPSKKSKKRENKRFPYKKTREKEWLNIKTPKSILNKLLPNGYKYVTRSGNTILVHRLVWEEQFGVIPKGMDIHHKDGNKLNNKIENLECLSRKEHGGKHKRDK